MEIKEHMLRSNQELNIKKKKSNIDEQKFWYINFFQINYNHSIMFKSTFNKNKSKLMRSEGPDSVSPDLNQDKMESGILKPETKIHPFQSKLKLKKNKESLGKRNYFTFDESKTEKSLYVETGLGTTTEFFEGWAFISYFQLFFKISFYKSFCEKF
jgi:hypothetical protein